MYEPIKNRSNHQYIVDEIKRMVLLEQLKVGDKLPPERELAELYQVSRTSVREALKSLEAQGLLEIRQGDGNYIANHLEEKSTDLLSLVFVLENCKMSDLTWLRYSFELNSLAYYADRKCEDEINRFKDIAERVKNATSYDELTALDGEMHEYIFEIEENKLFRFLHSSILTLYRENVKFANAENVPWYSKDLEASKNYILDLLDAIISLDMDRIKIEITAHYDWASEEISDTYSEFLDSLKANNTKGMY
ncbi:MAG: FadR family transcriptional regulator [Clostridiales bacterium]|nr:FadR family transcriptional regulator [Clostridiales bacterium]